MFPLKTKDALSWAISVSWIAEPLYLHYRTLRTIGAIQVQIDARERVQIQELPENWEDARDPHGKSPCDHRYRSFVGHSCVDHKTFSSCLGVQMQQLLGPPLPKLWCHNMFRPQKVNIRMDETTRSVPHTFSTSVHCRFSGLWSLQSSGGAWSNHQHPKIKAVLSTIFVCSLQLCICRSVSSMVSNYVTS